MTVTGRMKPSSLKFLRSLLAGGRSRSLRGLLL